MHSQIPGQQLGRRGIRVEARRRGSRADRGEWRPRDRAGRRAFEQWLVDPRCEIAHLDLDVRFCPSNPLAQSRAGRVAATDEIPFPRSVAYRCVKSARRILASRDGLDRQTRFPMKVGHRINGGQWVCQGVLFVPPAPIGVLCVAGSMDDKCHREDSGPDPTFPSMLLLASIWVLFGALRISEVMADPARVDDSRGEYVEVQARDGAVSMDGFRLVFSGRDTICLPNRILAQGSFWVLGRVGISDNGGFVPDTSLATGWGVPNSSGRIALLDPAGREVDVVTWSTAVSGSSLELCPGDVWKVSTAVFGIGDRGTPGGPNSCDDTPLALEGAVVAISQKSDSLYAVFLNRGLENWVGRSVEWIQDGEVVRTQRIDIRAGMRDTIALFLGPFRKARSRWVVRLPPDPRHVDDSMALWTRLPEGRIVFSEVQPADDAPEWVEVAQALPTALSLAGWTIGDQEPRARIPDEAILPAAGRLVLSANCAALRARIGVSTLPCTEPSPWPRLSVEADRLSLRDADQGLWDTISWSRAGGAWAKGRTRERQHLTDSIPVDQWLPSGAEGGTPGYGPEAAQGWSDGGGHFFGIASRRMRQGDPNQMLRMELKIPSEEALRIDLFDMGRRSVLRIHDGAPPRDGVLRWDGRDGGGQYFKPGVYVVVVETGPPKKPTWKAMEWIVVAPPI